MQSRIIEAKKRIDAAQAKATGAATTQSESNERLDKAMENLTERWSRNVATGAFTHLTPEQLCWSILQATDQIDVQRKAGAADYDKKNPLKKNQKSDAARDVARARHADLYDYDKLKGNIATFVKLFGGAAGEVQTEFYTTADQALYFANGTNLRGWITTLSSRLNVITESKAMAEELYLSILTRRPANEEIAAVEAYLSDQKDNRTNAIREMAWGLMTSTEFRFNH